LLSLFPYEYVRPIQREAFDVVATMFETGKGISILEAPTGSGKSALAFTAARYAGTLDDLDDEFEPGAYILTPYNNLAAAMTSDFGDMGLTAFFDFAAFQRVLGISDSLVFSAPSDFPLRNRPIIYRPVGDMAAKTMSRTIPDLCAEIERIVGSFSRCKGHKNAGKNEAEEE
jgi:Rad3-related DNA helicase